MPPSISVFSLFSFPTEEMDYAVDVPVKLHFHNPSHTPCCTFVNVPVKLEDGDTTTFSMKKIRNATDKLSNVLRRGMFSTVYYGTLDDGTRIAIKKAVIFDGICIAIKKAVKRKTGTAFVMFDRSQRLTLLHCRYQMATYPFHAKALALMEALEYIQTTTQEEHFLILSDCKT